MEKVEVLASITVSLIASAIVLGLFALFDYAGLNLFESIVCVYLTIIVLRK